MGVCLEKMLTTKKEVAGVIKLETLRNTNHTPMFLTWTAERFGEIWADITSAYETELALKTYIKENIAHTPDEDNRLFFVASWVNQPYIGSNIDTSVEALLRETGHR